jgi:RecA/RadA recombinase
MSKKKDSLGYLGYRFQQELINQILHQSPHNRKFAERIIGILHAKYFDNQYFRLIVAYTKDYYEKYEKIPTWETLESVVRAEVKDDVTKEYVFSMMKEIESLDVEDWNFVQEKGINFCRQQELKAANQKISKILDSGDFDRYQECEEILKEALMVGAEKDEGIDVSDELEEVLSDDFRHPIPTGITGLDNLMGGGLSKGELGIVLAPYGIGKSTILTKISNTAYNCGNNVLQVIFEDMPKVIQRKHMSCWTGVELNKLSENKDEVITKVKEITNRENRLIIKKFPSEGTTMNDIKQYIRGLYSKGIKIDVVVLDYIDCVVSTKSYSEEWSAEGQIMRAFETMLYEENLVGWTAIQGNRQSISSDVVTGDQTGGSIKKLQIGHFIVSVAKSLAQKESNRATIAVLKSRFGKDGVIFEDCTFDNGRVFIDTETSADTFLGYEKKQEEKKEDRMRERIKRAQELNKVDTST